MPKTKFKVQINYDIEAENIEEARDAIIYGEDKPIGKTQYKISGDNQVTEITEEQNGK